MLCCVRLQVMLHVRLCGELHVMLYVMWYFMICVMCRNMLCYWLWYMLRYMTHTCANMRWNGLQSSHRLLPDSSWQTPPSKHILLNAHPRFFPNTWTLSMLIPTANHWFPHQLAAQPCHRADAPLLWSPIANRCSLASVTLQYALTSIHVLIALQQHIGIAPRQSVFARRLLCAILFGIGHVACFSLWASRHAQVCCGWRACWAWTGSLWQRRLVDGAPICTRFFQSANVKHHNP